MTDIETKRRLTVNTEGNAGPYLMVPLDQLPEVRNVLQQNGIGHVVAPDAIGLNGRPVIAIIDFGRSADVGRIQAVLDAA
ncbi:MAG: hypothetical protein ABSB42_04250 [Tepidisphaeraceae bacterium]|jgi:hypothetical protein